MFLPVFFLVLAALIAGLSGGLFGVGGGTILVPAYILILKWLHVSADLAPKIAIATSLATIVFLSLGSVSGHIKAGVFKASDVLMLGLGGAVGAAIGSQITLRLPGEVLTVSFGIFCLIIGFRVYISTKPKYQRTRPLRVFLLPAIGFTSGIMSSLFGIGGGAVAVPLMLFAGLTMHRAIAASSGMIVLNSLAGTVGFLLATTPQLGEAEQIAPYMSGFVVLPAAGLVGMLAFGAARAGTRLAHAVDAHRLKRYFAWFLIGLGVAFVTGLL